MKEITIEDVTRIVNVISNSLFGDLKTKEMAQNSLIKLIGLSCQKYHSDERFKREIDHLTLRALKQKPLIDPLKKVSPR